MLLETCICGSDSGTEKKQHQIPVVICSDCGVVRQAVDMTSEGLREYYQKDYFQGVYTHGREQDEEVARSRIQAYGLQNGRRKCRSLDVGCGRGSFVYEMKQAGHEAIGLDLSSVAKSDYKTLSTYHEPLEEVHFPTDRFGVVTLHDVLEHSPDPVSLLKEVFRITQQHGQVLVEVPDFQAERHWKLIEHLWMFTESDLRRILEEVGFTITGVSNPVDGKILFDCRKPHANRVSVLVPPGLGDSYWSFVKLRGMLQEKKIWDIPDVYVAALDRSNQSLVKRSFGWIEKIPFLHLEGNARMRQSSSIWRKAYFDNGPTLFEDVFGCDFFLAYNGILRHGRSLEEVDSKWACEWFFPEWRSLNQRELEETCLKKYGKYILVHLIWDRNVYQRWLNDFPLEEIGKSLRAICKELDCRAVFVGFDTQFTPDMHSLINNEPLFINRVGDTSVDEMQALSKSSLGVFGFPSGLEILAVKNKVPTLVPWNSYFRKNFWQFAMAPESRGTWYRALPTKGLTEKVVVDNFLELVECKS